jgi:S-formylglutathione hydrolase FrmB
MKQWSRLGLDDELNRLAAAGERVPFIVVMPTGLAGYWVNHADGGPLWGDYITKDLVSYVDATYRTIARRDARAIGGISMGGHGALQLTLNNPDLFGVVGAHSPALRPRPDAPPFLGGYFLNLSGGPGQAAYEARDPISLVRHSTLATPPTMWIDTGDKDPWMPRVQELHAALVAHGWAHEWQPAKGDHDGGYWHRRMADYVGFYRRALRAVA